MSKRRIAMSVVVLSASILFTIGIFSAVASFTDFSGDPVGAFVYVTSVTGVLLGALFLFLACLESTVAFFLHLIGDPNA